MLCVIGNGGQCVVSVQGVCSAMKLALMKGGVSASTMLVTLVFVCRCHQHLFSTNTCVCVAANHHMPLKSGSHQSADHGSHNQSSTFPSASQILAHLFLAPWFNPHYFFLFWNASVLLMLSCCLSPFDHHHHLVTGMFQHHSNLAALIHQSDVHFANTFHHCQWSTPHCLPSASSSSGLSAATATSITPDHQH